MYQRILLPLDGSEVAARAIPHAAALAKAFGASVTILHVVTAGSAPRRPLPPDEGADEGDVQRDLEGVKQRLLREGAKDAHWVVTVGEPAEEVIRAAREYGSDLLVMSTHGRGSAFQWLFGSVASKVLHAVGIPVVLLRSPQAIRPVP